MTLRMAELETGHLAVSAPDKGSRGTEMYTESLSQKADFSNRLVHFM